MVVLDTDHITLLEWTGRADTERLRARLAALKDEEKAATIISYEEQTRGWLAVLAKARVLAQQIEAYERLARQLRNYCAIRLLDFDEPAATHFQRLKQAKLRLGTMDLKIASIVLAHDATLLSRNLSDFKRVPDLKVEDWSG